MGTYSIHQAARGAANVARSRLEQWISRGYVQPKDTPDPGTARTFSDRDMMSLALFAEIVRLGIDPKIAASLGTEFVALRDLDDKVFVAWKGPTELIATSERGSAPSKGRRSGHKFFDPDWPGYAGFEVLRAAQLSELIGDPDKHSCIAVHLGHLESRMRDRLSRLEKALDR